MNSMTGYGRCSEHNETLEVTVEINSVNRKSLDIFTSLPRDWQAMEKGVLEVLRAELLRGKVNVNVQVNDLTKTTGLSWDDEVISETLKSLKALAEKNSVPFEPDADLLVRLVTAIGASNELPDFETNWPFIESVLKGALTQLQDMRAAEGKALFKDMQERIAQMQAWVKSIQSFSESVVPQYKEQLLQRLQKSGLELDLEDERVLKEISIFADRCDITEELTRLSSHFEQFIKTMKNKGAVGRKLDFLCQEINREINTIGSKANNLDITKHVIDCKNELERIREQVQNVE